MVHLMKFYGPIKRSCCPNILIQPKFYSPNLLKKLGKQNKNFYPMCFPSCLNQEDKLFHCNAI